MLVEAGALAALGSRVGSLGCKRMLVVADAHVVDTHAAAAVASLSAAGGDVTLHAIPAEEAAEGSGARGTDRRRNRPLKGHGGRHRRADPGHLPASLLFGAL